MLVVSTRIYARVLPRKKRMLKCFAKFIDCQSFFGRGFIEEENYNYFLSVLQILLV